VGQRPSGPVREPEVWKARPPGGNARWRYCEWLVRGPLNRSDLHILLTESVLHLLKVIYPAIAATKPDEG
jgi:hypothetical protein